MASLTEYDVQPILHGDGDIKNKLSEIAYQYALQNAYTYADAMGLKSSISKKNSQQSSLEQEQWQSMGYEDLALRNESVERRRSIA